jgi:hypothetical protein
MAKRDPVQQALRHIQAEVDHVLDHHGNGAAQRELGDALVEMGVALGAERPTRPRMTLSELGQQPPEVQPQTPNPEAPPSDVAALLQQMNNR